MKKIIGLSAWLVVLVISPMVWANNATNAYQVGLIQGVQLGAKVLYIEAVNASTGDIALKKGEDAVSYYKGILKTTLEGGKTFQKLLGNVIQSQAFKDSNVKGDLKSIVDRIENKIDDIEGSDLGLEEVAEAIGSLAELFNDTYKRLDQIKDKLMEE